MRQTMLTCKGLWPAAIVAHLWLSLLPEAGHASSGSRKIDTAISKMQRAEERHGTEAPLTLSAKNDLAGHYYEAERYDKAEGLYKEVLAVREKVLGPEHPDTLDSLEKLAILYRRVGPDKLALPLLRRVLSARERSADIDRRQLIEVTEQLAYLLYRYKDHQAEAEQLFVRAFRQICRCRGDTQAYHAKQRVGWQNISNLRRRNCWANFNLPETKTRLRHRTFVQEFNKIA
jgi:tetratricopeptide (TPR) repeat protein